MLVLTARCSCEGVKMQLHNRDYEISLNVWITHKTDGKTLTYGLKSDLGPDEYTEEVRISSASGGDLWSIGFTGKTSSGNPFVGYVVDKRCDLDCTKDANRRIDLTLYCNNGDCDQMFYYVRKPSGDCYWPGTVKRPTLNPGVGLDKVDALEMFQNNLAHAKAERPLYFSDGPLIGLFQNDLANKSLKDSDATCVQVRMGFQNFYTRTIYGLFYVHKTSKNHEKKDFITLANFGQTDASPIEAPSGLFDYWSFAYLSVASIGSEVPELGFVLDKRCNLECNGKDKDDYSTVQLQLLLDEFKMGILSGPCTAGINKILPSY
ncbi:unnamed protein product [Sphagnum balticum]